MKLAVIIVNYNVAYFLEQCLASVEKAKLAFEKQFGKALCEVIVVDNASKDDSVAMIEEKHPWVSLIQNKKNVGFAKANNQALRQVNADYKLLLNPDTVVQVDTFTSTVNFMDKTPQSGALGVYMIDGKGQFLPESKRGFPSPAVAFFKIFGISALFPKSKLFGQYHLGYLDKNKIHQVGALSGAFMLLRNSTLKESGLLDEDYFMYGEDIDLSYRIQLAGYKNYYFPHTKIIHYKGESTKKGSVNYVFVFYKAMAIFAKKHFGRGKAHLFSMLINVAIIFRASIAVLSRIVKRFAMPFADAVALFILLELIKIFWENYATYSHGGGYPWFISFIYFPVYIFIWLITNYFSGGYDLPYKLQKTWRGIFFGSLLLLASYSLLDESLRFSRAVLLMGVGAAFLATTFNRLFLQAINPGKNIVGGNRKKNIIILGGREESKRIKNVLLTIMPNTEIVGYVVPDSRQVDDALGHYSQLEDILSLHSGTNELIFCNKDFSAEQIMGTMYRLNEKMLHYKIAPAESDYIIGSNYIHGKGQLYTFGLNSINKPSNRRNKRLFDLLAVLFLSIAAPCLVFFIKNPGKFIKNILHVALGRKTWVGYINIDSTNVQLPKLKAGVLSLYNGVKTDKHNNEIAQKLNIMYAKDYKTRTDLNLLLTNIKRLGK